jgi:hypothetical protein
MKVSRETKDLRVQASIAADARMREVAKKSVHWPDPDKPHGERKPLGPRHVLQGSMAEKIQQSQSPQDSGEGV